MSTQHSDADTTEVVPQVDAGFLQFLQHHRSGNLLSDLSKGMREAGDFAEQMGKPAFLVLKIAIKPAGHQSGAHIIVDKLQVKLPEPQPVSSFFFRDASGNFVRNDPRQRELPLRAIQGGAPVDVTELKQAKAI